MFDGYLQQFRERLSEKVHATIPKGIVGGLECSVQRNLKEMSRDVCDVMFAITEGKQQK